MAMKLAVIDRSCCVACGVCVRECPKAAISVWKGCFAKPDEAACVGCGKCAKACPAGCISVRAREAAR